MASKRKILIFVDLCNDDYLKIHMTLNEDRNSEKIVKQQIEILKELDIEPLDPYEDINSLVAKLVENGFLRFKKKNCQ